MANPNSENEIAVIESTVICIDDPVDEVQNNIKGLLSQGTDALEYALELAKQSDSPRAFEVVGTLIKNLSDMNMQLIDTHEKKMKFRESKKEPEPQSQPNTVNNSIIFNGSTAEFNAMLEQIRNK